MTICTFTGHRQIFHADIGTKVEAILASILTTDDAFLFLTGGMGEFDNLCASTVRSLKRQHPQLDIRLALVLPYLTKQLNANKEYYEVSYDEIIVPAELIGIHYKAAIKMRNQWLVDQASHVIAYVHRDFGGAADTLKYAHKQGKTVINLSLEESYENL